jgi:hypothetical protein
MKVNRITKKNGKIETTRVELSAPVYNVRIKPEIYEPLVIQAGQERRSITAHINYLLERHLADHVQ